MAQPNNKRVRDWIRSMPGLFSGATPGEAMAKAHAASGVECSIEDFEKILKDVGIATKCVRDGLYYLMLPDRNSAGVTGVRG